MSLLALQGLASTQLHNCLSGTQTTTVKRMQAFPKNSNFNLLSLHNVQEQRLMDLSEKAQIVFGDHSTKSSGINSCTNVSVPSAAVQVFLSSWLCKTLAAQNMQPKLSEAHNIFLPIDLPGVLGIKHPN